jgi:hypothetical protein
MPKGKPAAQRASAAIRPRLQLRSASRKAEQGIVSQEIKAMLLLRHAIAAICSLAGMARLGKRPEKQK